ncbi:hypothetical protein BCL79_2164 [Stenotrophomonas rhizophila]|uniref:Uncharacterized protein n=1 Tax=Stenotrophomonas rhizophila TaxID=216778 RepID=A0A498CM73_9GAMM|nr:hypothetical protein [Stenotrophomonas rhizophila]RLK57750.1 hypothetical protein BCL79_2164 [Stenotrophomonas rhizophila]
MKGTNWFVRGLIIALCIFLAAGIGYRFIYLQPAGDLGLGVLLVLALLVVLVLSESFNAFSIGSLLSLSREVDKKKAEVSDLKTENRELRSQVISIATTVSQRQTSTNIVGLPQDLARMFTVRAAEETEVQEKQDAEQAAPEEPAPRAAVPRLDRRKLEQRAIERFLKANDLEQFPVVREAKLMAQIEVLDPVSTSSPIFDAYLNSLDSEIFVEIRVVSQYSVIFFKERLYVMLTKLSHYKALKKSNVFMALVLVTMPGEEARPSQISRLFSEFQPAIAGGLLRIVEFGFSQEDVADLYENGT